MLIDPNSIDPLPSFEDEREWEDLQRAHDALAQQLKALREQAKAQRMVLRELYLRLDDEADITHGGGPNLAMRLSTEFREAFEALGVTRPAPALPVAEEGRPF